MWDARNFKGKMRNDKKEGKNRICFISKAGLRGWYLDMQDHNFAQVMSHSTTETKKSN